MRPCGRSEFGYLAESKVSSGCVKQTPRARAVSDGDAPRRRSERVDKIGAAIAAAGSQ